MRIPLALALLCLTSFCSDATAADNEDVVLSPLMQYVRAGKIPQLSTDTNKPTASQFFGFTARMAFARGFPQQIRAQSTDLHVWAESWTITVLLVTTSSGEPYAYMANDLFVAFADASKPGQLTYIEGGAPVLMLGGELNKEAISFRLLYDRRFLKPDVTLNVLPFVNPSAVRRAPRYDDASRAASWTTAKGSQVMLRFSDSRDDNKFGLNNVYLKSESATISLSGISIDQPPLHELPTLKLKHFMSLGITLVPAEPAVTLPTLVRSDFLETEQEKRAVVRLKTLFPHIQ